MLSRLVAVCCCVMLWLCTLDQVAFGQSLGDPVVKITFGSGTAVRAGALAADSGSTTYTYAATGQIGENYYTITNLCNTNIHSGFVTSTDHTGDTGGYMMVVNGNLTAGTVFTRSVNGLCEATQYQFGVWIKNVLSTNGILPNMVFHIYAADGTTELGTGVSTGDVPTGNIWHNYIANFTLPAGTGSVIIKLVSNASGQQGNDFAVDDITFSPYGSTVAAVFDNSTATSETTCAGSPQTYTINATSTLASGYVQKLQQNINGTWTDIGAASTATSFSVTSPIIAGTYQYRLVSALSSNISSASCVVSSNYLTIVVKPSPTAAFTSTSPVCLGSAVSFTDASVSNGSTISSWTWDFGDGTSATTQNPSHIYTAPGTYTAKLTVAAAGACLPSSVTHTVTINALPTPAFTTSTPNCAGKAVTFTDQSVDNGNSITTRLWDYGDGSTETRTSNAAFTHTYTTAGTYTIKLTLTNATNCTQTISKTLVISPLPVADFTLPDVCLSDAYAQFTNTSSISDNSQAGFTYLWNFGDASATTANPNTSTDKNARHKYSQAGNYTVTLTVTSASGCVSQTASKAFTVNGAVPKAGLTITNSANLCSSDQVAFVNTSTVDFGNITKIVLYFNYGNAPTVSSTFYRSLNQIPADNTFYHSYGVFNSPATKTYHVKMQVYSGETCFDTYDQDIVLHANPVITLSSIGPLCQNDAPVQIAENKNGFSGTGVFSGPGVSSTGLFNPTTVGPGTFTINYAFTAVNGCGYSTAQQVTVYSNPTVSLPASIGLLEGGQVLLSPTIKGSSLTYKWTPATGLSADNVASPYASPSADMTYTLTVTNANGCTATASISVSVLKTPVIPNTITPNGDGVNDIWSIKYLDSYPNCRVQVFNRYGKQLFYSVGYPIAWDGRFNGADLPQGVYYYVIAPGNGRNTMAGSLTILR